MTTETEERTVLQQFLGFHEIRTRKFWKAIVSEFLATAILIVAGCGAGVTMEAGKPVSSLTGALTWGMTVAMVIWTFNHASGAHINPAVTLSFMVTGHMTIAKTLTYIIAQCSGAIAGAAIVWYMVPENWRGNIGSTVFAEGVTTGQGFAIETMSTFLMMMGVFASGDRLRTDHGGSVPLTVGLIVFTQSAWAGKPTSCSMNPARTLGPALISGTWDHHWVYWVAPCVGAIIGGLFYQNILAETPSANMLTHHLTIHKKVTRTASNSTIVTMIPGDVSIISTPAMDDISKQAYVNLAVEDTNEIFANHSSNGPI